MSSPSHAPRAWPFVGSLLVIAAALLWFWPTLDDWFRSDDFFTVALVDRATGSVQWSLVGEHFLRPWFHVPDMYRPLVSLSFAINRLFGGDATGFHFVNVAIVGVTAAGVAAIAARLAPRLPTLAAVVAAVLVLVHPATVEATAWISARTTGLQVMFATVASALFVRATQLDRPQWPALVVAALAMLSKEGAVVLPLQLFALDLVGAPRRPLAQRVRLLLPFVVLTVVYLAWRYVVLGVLTTSESHHTLLERAGNVAARAWNLFGALDPDGRPALTALVAFAGLFALAAVRGAAWLLLLLLAAVGLLLPTSHMQASASRLDGRLVFDAVPLVGIASGLAVVAATLSRWWRVGAAVAVLTIAGLVPAGRAWVARYDDEGAMLRALQADMIANGGNDAAKPFGCTALPDQPLLPRQAAGLMAMSPFAPRDLPFICLSELTDRTMLQAAMVRDLAPVRALHDLGGGFGYWLEGERRMVACPRAALPTGLAVLHADGNVFTASAPIPAAAVSAITVECPVASRRFSLRFTEDLPEPLVFGVRELECPSPTTSVTFDVTRAAVLIVRMVSAGVLPPIAIEIDGAPAPAGTVVRVLADIATGPAGGPAADATVALADLARQLVPPRADIPLRLYLMTPFGVRCADVAPGAATVFDAPTQFMMDCTESLLGTFPLHWFWQTRADQPAPFRSALGHCRVD